MGESKMVASLAQRLNDEIPRLAGCRVGVVLGSSLGVFADELEDPAILEYAEKIWGLESIAVKTPEGS